ncbi:hypothetical protein [Vibrio sp. 10N.286.48.B7]|uniref:hypothetical protein n=1 Tax=Vibrio sp. 10N.286.48.B7 TaxID=1880853 RepID=UPI000C81EB03|nr:hypothetical protein [Vibrio sp. 10N.286.48.B7]PMH81195.1 hypothetical protein BCU58_02880 [Vibrio sp. 10N.286.48.B7]
MYKSKAVVTLLSLALSLTHFSAVAHPSGHHGHGHGHKHKHHKEVIVVKKHKPSPKKKKPKHKHYHYKSMPRQTTYIRIGNFTYANVEGHYYQRQGDRYINVILN